MPRLSVNTDEELTWRLLGVGFPRLGGKVVHVPLWPWSSSDCRGVSEWAAAAQSWVVVCSAGQPCPWPVHGRVAVCSLLSGLLYIIWLPYGNDNDVAVPSVFL
jgi:hypothetical protein